MTEIVLRTFVLVLTRVELKRLPKLQGWRTAFGEIIRSKLGNLKYFLTQPFFVKIDLHADRCEDHSQFRLVILLF